MKKVLTILLLFFNLNLFSQENDIWLSLTSKYELVMNNNSNRSFYNIHLNNEYYGLSYVYNINYNNDNKNKISFIASPFYRGLENEFFFSYLFSNEVEYGGEVFIPVYDCLKMSIGYREEYNFNTNAINHIYTTSINFDNNNGKVLSVRPTVGNMNGMKYLFGISATIKRPITESLNMEFIALKGFDGGYEREFFNIPNSTNLDVLYFNCGLLYKNPLYKLKFSLEYNDVLDIYTFKEKINVIGVLVSLKLNTTNIFKN